MHIHPVCEYDALFVLYVTETRRRGRSGGGGFVLGDGDRFEVEGGGRGGGQDGVFVTRGQKEVCKFHLCCLLLYFPSCKISHID